MRSGIRASSGRRARSFGRHTCCWLDVGSRPAPALASSRDRTDDEAPMSTIPKRARGLSSKRPYRRPVGTSRSTPRHRHRADGDGRRESWPNTRCRPIARPPRRRSQSKFRRHISIAAFCLTSATRSAAASPRSLCDETRRRIIVNYNIDRLRAPDFIETRLESRIKIEAAFAAACAFRFVRFRFISVSIHDATMANEFPSPLARDEALRRRETRDSRVDLVGSRWKRAKRKQRGGGGGGEARMICTGRGKLFAGKQSACTFLTT